MRKNGTYYLARIAKVGQLDTKSVIEALRNQEPLLVGDHNWVVSDYQEFLSGDEVGFIVGNLMKFKPDGAVEVFDADKKTGKRKGEPNLSIAKSPFIYIPRFSGFAFMHVWNDIPRDVFVERMRHLIISYYDNFFVDCHIEFISSLRQFAARLAELDSINEIKARVSPPNPLFGPAWENLKDYLRKRNASNVKHEEAAQPGAGLNSTLPEVVQAILKHRTKEPLEFAQPVPIGDAAILMAADGYGSGYVRGKDGPNEVIVHTSETAVSFKFPVNPDPQDFHARVSLIFEKVNRERDLKH